MIFNSTAYSFKGMEIINSLANIRLEQMSWVWAKLCKPSSQNFTEDKEAKRLKH